MAKTQPLQTSFTSGVLNPGLAARTDIEHYYQGLKRGRNVICTKEGGVRGRWGLKHVTDVPTDGRLVPFSFNTEQNYLLYFGNAEMRVVVDETLITNINGSGNPYLTVPWTVTQALELDYTQSADTLVLVHQSVSPRTIVRGASHSTWTLATASLINLPKYDFDDAFSPGSAQAHIVDVTFNSFSAGQRYKLELNDFETPEIVYATSSTAAGRAANERRIRDEMLALPPTGFDESTLTVAFQSGTTYRITFGGDSADDYEPMSGRNTDNTAASISFNVTQTGIASREDVISGVRGWPIAVMFYESRLWFLGLSSLPQSILGTVIGGFVPFDFKLGTGLDDEGVFVTLNTQQVNAIRAGYPGRHFQVFTSGGEFYSPDRPMTPAPALPQQSRFGCASAIKPVEVDGATIYCTDSRKTLREYLFLWAEEAYNATSLTVLASHLFHDIRSMAALTSTSDDEDSYVITLNGDAAADDDADPNADRPEPGTGAVLNTLRAQDIAAWTELVTRDGDELKQACVVGDDIYFLCKRQRNGSTVYTIEKASFSTRLDASLKKTTALGTTMGGFDHLAGETVDILVDGAPVAQQTVNASGQLFFDEAPTTSVEAGYFVPPIVETMPLTVNLGGQPLLGAKKRITEIRAYVKSSLGIIANGVKIPDKVPGATVTATPDTPYTGLRKIRDLGWTEGDATITLTQDQPLPFHILALTAQLEVGQT